MKNLRPITIIRLVLSIVSLLCILIAFIIAVCQFVNTNLKSDELTITSYVLTVIALIGILVVLISNRLTYKSPYNKNDKSK